MLTLPDRSVPMQKTELIPMLLLSVCLVAKYKRLLLAESLLFHLLNPDPFVQEGRKKSSFGPTKRIQNA